MSRGEGVLSEAEEEAMERELAARDAQKSATVKRDVPLRVVGPNDGPPPEPFEAGLRRNPQGGVLSSYGNTVMIARGLWGAALAMNAMEELIEFGGESVGDATIGRLRCEVEQRFSFAPKVDEITKALIQVAEERRYHPVQHHLGALAAWDGIRRWVQVPRANFGLPYTEAQCLSKKPPLHCTLLERWAISCVARAFEPGCQVDHVLTLQGAEERRKSTFFRVLGGKWFGEGDVQVDVEGVRALSGVWIMCWDELAGLTRRDQQSLDGFITRPRDLLRPLWRNWVKHPRSSVIVATAGPGELIHAPTGGRRWWIIPVLRKMLDGEIEPVRDQLWAEALHLYREGLKTVQKKATWWLDSDDEIAEHADLIDECRVTSGLDVPVATYLSSSLCLSLLERGGRQGWITVNDVLEGLDVAAKDRDNHGLATKVGSALRKAGWAAVVPRPRFNGMRVSAYAPPQVT